MPKEPIQNLSAQLKAVNLTRADLAEELQKARGTLYQRLKNPGKFTVEEILVLAKVLNKTPTAIFKAICRESQIVGLL